MKRVKYIYNEQTLQYEECKISGKERVRKGLNFISAVLFTSVILFILAYQYFPTPKEKLLERQHEQLQFHLANLTEDYDRLSAGLDELHQKDGNVHRMIFGIKPMDENIWSGGVGGHNKYSYLENFKETGKMISASLSKVDNLKRKMELQKKSLDSLYSIALTKEKRLASIPSIKPVKEDALSKNVKFLSGFGMRIHPIHKIKKFHKGIDFTAPQGTDIQATGDGRIVSINKTGSGFGKHLMIDHGFGYKTLYAHMHSITVKEGQIVKKGQKIGVVGSTGASTAPHLHYEVWLNGVAINPVDYVLDGLSSLEYQELVKRATLDNQSFD